MINMPYNMYHKRPLDAQNAQPIPMPGGGRSERPLKERSDKAGSKDADAAGHGDRGAILAGATVSPLGPQRIIAEIWLSYGVISSDPKLQYSCSTSRTAVLQYCLGSSATPPFLNTGSRASQTHLSPTKGKQIQNDPVSMCQ